MFRDTQSVRNETYDICDHVMQANFDLVFLCENGSDQKVAVQF